MTFSQSDTLHPGNTLRRTQRLHSRHDFEALRKHGFSRAHPLLLLRAAPNSLPRPRFAFVVSRRVTRKAVIRNRVRRRLREVARQIHVRAGWDLLFIARPQAAGASFQALSAAALSVTKQAKLLDFAA